MDRQVAANAGSVQPANGSIAMENPVAMHRLEAPPAPIANPAGPIAVENAVAMQILEAPPAPTPNSRGPTLIRDGNAMEPSGPSEPSPASMSHSSTSTVMGDADALVISETSATAEPRPFAHLINDELRDQSRNLEASLQENNASSSGFHGETPAQIARRAQDLREVAEEERENAARKAREEGRLEQLAQKTRPQGLREGSEDVTLGPALPLEMNELSQYSHPPRYYHLQSNH